MLFCFIEKNHFFFTLVGDIHDIRLLMALIHDIHDTC